MKRKLNRVSGAFTVCLVALLCSALVARPQSKGKVNVGFVYPVSTGGSGSARDTNIFSLHALVGVSGVERGPSFAGLSQVVLKEASGVRVAGLSNHTGGNASGIQFAGLLNTSKDLKGLSVASLANFSGRLDGFQFAGVLNKARETTGTQLAGLSNIAGSVKGLQLAGLTNVAAGDVEGTQISGFLNVARKVKGIQFSAFMNIAEQSDYPVGLINLVRNGEKSLGVSIDETASLMLNFKSGGRVLYGIVALGYNLKNREEVYAFEGGFGAHVLNAKSFRLDLEATAQTLEDFRSGDYMKSSLKVLPSWSFGPMVVFAGPTFNYLNTNTAEGRDLFRHRQHTWNGSEPGNLQALYIGYTAGLQVRL
ncbi:hypothetical protein C7T94_13695 [Pedobacter yulinensis]|uniref:DUF5723 domain-containing protein n=1 Tax=Pedobacter yulinensis TaxID=2126353 RepID=A0A2T3HMC4_9SPHI|nr:hypothetical protein [Pedobacter yulinensis]PST83590.1 hypothetical protein C7T94_13695 [Pedobacter yulinensis]